RAGRDVAAPDDRVAFAHAQALVGISPVRPGAARAEEEVLGKARAARREVAPELTAQEELVALAEREPVLVLRVGLEEILARGEAPRAGRDLRVEDAAAVRVVEVVHAPPRDRDD